MFTREEQLACAKEIYQLENQIKFMERALLDMRQDFERASRRMWSNRNHDFPDSWRPELEEELLGQTKAPVPETPVTAPAGETPAANPKKPVRRKPANPETIPANPETEAPAPETVAVEPETLELPFETPAAEPEQPSEPETN